MQPYKKTLKSFSRDLRSNMTDAEQMLWSRLRRKQICGVQFYRQKPLMGYIVDFYCAAANLVIELDGSQHFEADQKQYDIERTKILQSLGLQVLRFDNGQVLTELDNVMAVIFDVVRSQIPSASASASASASQKEIPPNPPFSKGGTQQPPLKKGVGEAGGICSHEAGEISVSGDNP